MANARMAAMANARAVATANAWTAVMANARMVAMAFTRMVVRVQWLEKQHLMKMQETWGTGQKRKAQCAFVENGSGCGYFMSPSAVVVFTYQSLTKWEAEDYETAVRGYLGDIGNCTLCQKQTYSLVWLVFWWRWFRIVASLTSVDDLLEIMQLL